MIPQDEKPMVIVTLTENELQALLRAVYAFRDTYTGTSETPAMDAAQQKIEHALELVL